MKKTILITGSTDGIGKLTAIKLAQEGHQIYLHGRNATKLHAVISEIKQLSSNEKIQGFVADFADLDAVIQMAKQVQKELSEIDVLINNAGIFKSSVTQNKNGLDTRLVVNYLAPYLLTQELMPLLTKHKNSRLINLSSAAQSPVSHRVFLGKESLSTQEAYAQSKLALTMWSFYLSEKHPDLTVIAVNPGSLLNTRMVKEAFGNFWSPADKGANILFDLAVSDTYQRVSGKYFDNDRGGFGRAHADAYDQNAIHNLIEATDGLLKTI